MVHRFERPTDRVEFEIGWLAFGMLLGLGYLSTEPSAAVRAILPAWFAYVWATAFLLGGLVGMWSMRRTFVAPNWNRYYWGLAGERAGHTLHAAAVSTLAVAAVYLWRRAPGTPFPVLSLALVGVWLAIALRRIVRTTQIIKAMNEIEGEAADGQH
jgi:hypothetical protein